MFSCNIVLLLFLFIFVSLSSCSLILFLGVSCQAIVLSLPRCKCCQHSFSVWFIDGMLSFRTTLLFRFCFFVFRVKLLLWIKLIVYTFEFDDRANYNVANVLMFRFNLLSLTSMFLNVIVFGTNNVAKAIMLLVLRNRWIEPSKSIATVLDHNFIKLFMYSACLLKCMTLTLKVLFNLSFTISLAEPSTRLLWYLKF